MRWLVFIFLIILFSEVVMSSECDWEIKILMDSYVFNGSEDVNWTVKIFRNEGIKANLSVRGYVKNVMSNWIMDYKPWTNETIANYRNKGYSPNLQQGMVYLVEFNITESSCNDSKLENNFDSRLIMVLPKNFGGDYNKIKINEFLPNPEGYDDSAMPSGEWVELYNSGDKVLNISGLILNDNYGDGLVISDVNVLNSTIIDPSGFLVVYRNGDGKFELNNEGFDKVSLFGGDILLDEVSYSSSSEGVSWSKINGIWEKSISSPGFENLGKNNESVLKSWVSIKRIYDLGEDEKAKFGQVIRVNVNLYKGDSTENVVKIWVKNKESVSKQSKVNVYTKFTNYTLTLPVQIYPNCDKEFEDGRYEVAIEGFGEEDSKEIEIEGVMEELCKEVKIYVEKECVEKEDELEVKEEVVCLPSEIRGSETGEIGSEELIKESIVYETKSIKAKKSAIWFFCGLLVLLLVFWIWRKSF